MPDKEPIDTEISADGGWEDRVGGVGGTTLSLPKKGLTLVKGEDMWLARIKVSWLVEQYAFGSRRLLYHII